MFAPHWFLASVAAGGATDPRQLDELDLDWVAAVVPGTVAQALQRAGRWTIDIPQDFDAVDWWYRCAFDGDQVPSGACILRFDGLATLADVWLNGTHVLQSHNMFVRYEVPVTALHDSLNELTICFRSLNADLARRRPRPRWKTKLVERQQLRWIRTSLLGRIPGWSPPVAPVGPWRGIVLEPRASGAVSNVALHPWLDGETGVVDVSASVAAGRDLRVAARLSVGAAVAPLGVQWGGEQCELRGRVMLDRPELWWPHTHGTPALHKCTLHVTTDGVDSSVDLGRVGFRRVAALNGDGGFELRINDAPVFCRGACWTVNDIVSLDGRTDDYVRALSQLRDAGANMVRVGGTMTYEHPDFYRLCDELGLLVWQDFMFANMDYPADDPAFAASVEREAFQQLQRLGRHACVAVYCGNSEVEQQAAMLGVPAERWSNRLFSEVLPGLCRRWHPSATYVPSTPSGGTLPFHVGTGIAHYYGVGAYLRPIADARTAGVRFATECLAFANVPARDVVARLMGGGLPAIHDPRWKRRTPRDTGAGWDFEDVRDHYLRDTYGVDPVSLRAFDPVRYLELGRVTTGEVMSRVFSEWRSQRNPCQGGLVWFYRDLWEGAGWGITDSRGTPKACYYFLRRAWQPRTILLTDDGLDGLGCHVVNDAPVPMTADLELTLLRDGHVVVAKAAVTCAVAARSARTIGADAVLGAFYDVTYAYRFGPPRHDVTIATLRSGGDVIAEAFHFPRAVEPRKGPARVSAVAKATGDDGWCVTVESDRFLYATHVDAPGFTTDDDYFHLPPNRPKTVTLRPNRDAGEGVLHGFVEALNLADAVALSLVE